MKHLISFFCLIAVATLGMSQQKLVFSESTHDFGEIKEGVQATHIFKFKNEGAKPTRLTNVRASCGCTTPKWTTEEVTPGGTGEIEVSYNSSGRPGPFTKNITVVADTAIGPITLVIKGNVKMDSSANNIAKAKPMINYEDTLGNLTFDSMLEQIGVLKSSEKKEMEFLVKNVGNKPISLKSVSAEKKNYTLITPLNTKIAPGQETTLKMQVDGKGLNEKNGYFSDRVSVITDDEIAPEKAFTIAGNFERIYTDEEKAKAPQIKFEQTEFDGGTIVQGEVMNYAFKFKNVGKSDLTIESAKASCGCTASAPKNTTIKPGESSQIDVSFNSQGRSGSQTKTITVVSNDLSQPNLVLTIKCSVVADPFHSKDSGAPSNEAEDPNH
jgi:uncharacterized cupredoxin-like copper-binding protein